MSFYVNRYRWYVRVPYCKIQLDQKYRYGVYRYTQVVYRVLYDLVGWKTRFFRYEKDPRHE